MKLNERRILVTGASRGIGQAVTGQLLRHGAKVVGIARDFGSRHPIPAGLDPVEMDLSLLESLPEASKALGNRYPDMDGVVFNAGFGRFGSLEEFSPGQIRDLIDLNLTSQILLARALIPQIKRRGRGDLIFIGSEAALAGHRKGAVYCATKFALRGFAHSLREECSGSGLRVTVINPGMVKSDFFNDLGFAPGEERENHLLPQDIADAVRTVLTAAPGVCFDEINLSPLKKVIRFK